MDTPISIPDSDQVTDPVNIPAQEEQSQLVESTEPVEEATKTIPTTEAKGIFEEATEESIGNASTTKDAGDIFGQTDEEDVDIFGNPSVKPVQEKNETESLFS